MTLELDAALAAKLKGTMQEGGTIELPFPVIYLWTINGQPSYKQQGGAMYYGGWCCKAEDAAVIAQEKALNLPVAWKHETITTRDSKEFEGLTTRALIVAPILKRESWIGNNGRRYTGYVEGGRRHIQMLALMGERVEKAGIQAWGPVVLTAKGYQARNLLDALARWDKDTAKIRWSKAPGIPAWLFWMGLGTFGNERQVINVGKPGAQSPITPIQLAEIKPEALERDLESLFVGNKVAQEMSDLADAAEPWRQAWKEESIESSSANGWALAGADAAFPAEEDIPF